MSETVTLLIEVPVTKRCSKCKRVLSYEEFAPGKSGLTAQCRECRSASSQRSKVRKKVGAPPPLRQCIDCAKDITDRGPSAKRCHSCQWLHTQELTRERTQRRNDSKEYKEQRASAWLDIPKNIRKRKQHALKLRKYNLTLDEYDAMLEAQGGVCAVCKQPETQVYKGEVVELAVDHDHSHCKGNYSCGKCIRGLVCGKHNAGLGHFQDDIEIMYAAIAYLETWEIKKEELLLDDNF